MLYTLIPPLSRHRINAAMAISPFVATPFIGTKQEPTDCILRTVRTYGYKLDYQIKRSANKIILLFFFFWTMDE